jgi:putative membrane protein
MATIANIAVALVALSHVYFLVLVWGLSLGAAGDAIKIFFPGFLVVAGVSGGLTVNRRIVLVQALPSGIALALVLLS